MPKVNYSKDGMTGSIVYDQNDWLLGLPNVAGSTFDQKFGNGSMVGIDPLRSYGYLEPGFSPIDVINVSAVTNYLRNAVVNGSSAYIISSGALLHQLTSILLGTITNSGLWPHTISGSSVAGDDICNYYNGSGTLCAFYSYSTSTTWNVGTFDYGSTFDDDFMSTVPTTPLGSPYITDGAGFPHPMLQGSNTAGTLDDVLYIGDRNYVHSYDRSTNTFTAAVLTLPKGWVITSFCVTQDLRVAIGAYYQTTSASLSYKGSAKVWYWTTTEIDVDYAIDLKDNYVSEVIPWGNTIAAFTAGARSISAAGPYKLQAQNGTQFEVIQTWTTGTLPIRGGVDYAQNDLYWNSQGNIYSFTKKPGGGYVFNNPITTAGGNSGLLKFFTNTRTIHVSSGSTTTGGLNYCFSGFGGLIANATFIGQQAAPSFDTLHQGRLSKVTIKFKDTASGGRTLRLNTYLNTTGVTLITDFSTVTNQRIKQVGSRSDSSPLGDFSTLAPEFIWQTGSGETAAPIVDWLKYEFEIVNI